MTMREKMIEAAAIAAFEANDIHPAWESSPEWWAMYRKRAEAALDAILTTLREPDDGMCLVGRDYDGVGNSPAIPAFTAMIDHIRSQR